jgi:hypothetical protein
MNVELTLAGCTLPWRMEGSTELSSWLRSRPWLELGGVKTARVARAHLEDTLTLIRREARASDDGVSDLRIWRLREDTLRLGLRQALEEWLDVSPRSEREFLKLLGEALEARPMLFLGWLGESRLPGESIEQARQVAEAVPKTGFRCAPTFVLLHPRQQTTGGTTTVLDTGLPMELTPLKEATGGDAPTLWRTYLHWRVAWEAGGDVERALRCDQLGLAGLRVGDDEACERLLNDHARVELKRMGAPERKQAHQWLEEMLVKNPPRGARPGMAKGTLAPWFARALLLEGSVPTARRFLKARLICTPLAELILTRCFELEALQRTRLMLHGLPEEVPTEARSRFERFQGPALSIERELYPSLHPALPEGPWDFASLGEFMENLVGLKPSTRKPLEQLRVLRNAIAHGHYVGWKALTRLWQAEQELSWG